MKTTKEAILLTSLNLFAESGFDAVSTSMIAERIGITKGALYRHFRSKQEIFDSIVQRMYDENGSSGFGKSGFGELLSYVLEQFDYWTADEFASSFRRMITLEQFKSPEKMKQYQDVIAFGPVKYLNYLFGEMINKGELNRKAKEMGAMGLAMELYAPLFLSISLSDGGADRISLKDGLLRIIKGFENKYSA